MPYRLARLLTILVLCIAGCYSPPAEGALVGKPETTVRQELGQPYREFEGHYGAPPIIFTEKFAGEIKSLVFRKSGGEIYMSFEKQNGEWIAISNSWLPTGSAF